MILTLLKTQINKKHLQAGKDRLSFKIKTGS
jgi:hypothetical protein